jgi:hypothetical protein
MTPAAVKASIFETTLSTVRQELPGIRDDLQRRIARQIAEKLSVPIYSVMVEKGVLEDKIRQLSANLERELDAPTPASKKCSPQSKPSN